jgi:hypothetical protein
MGGSFVSKEAESHFLRLSEAIEYLREHASNALIAVENSEIRALSSSVAILRSTVDRLSSDQSAQTKAEATLKRDISRPHRFIQITSTALAAACVAVWKFSEALPSNPLFAPLAKSPLFRGCMLGTLGISGLAFVMTSINEHRVKGMSEFLTSDDGISSTLYWLIHSQNSEEPEVEITRRLLAREIQHMGQPWHKLLVIRVLRSIFRVRLPLQFPDDVANIQIKVLIERSVIRSEGVRGIEQLYILESARAKEILEDQHRLFSPRQWW